MPKFAASDRQVTDGQVVKAIHARGIDEKTVEFSQDYAHRGLGKGHSPFAKFYRNLNGPEHWMVVSGLPMVDCDGDPCTPGWLAQGASGRYVAKNNQYRALIRGKDVELIVRNDDPFGRKKGAILAFSPRLFVGGVEIPAQAPVLLSVDPWNPNYQQNVLEWDYGVCKRKLRTVEGRVHGYWIFPANPGGDVLIRYGQTGDYRLKLGQYKQNDDEEFIPASVFALASYPFEVSDSATYNPDANEETTSVDGSVQHQLNNSTWSTIRDGAGTASSDSATASTAGRVLLGTNSDTYWAIGRGIFLFDTSALPDNANISAAVFSLYGSSKVSELNLIAVNVYSSAPASNTLLASGDYDSLGTTAYSDTSIALASLSTAAYNDWSLNASGISAISLSSVTKLGTRDANRDVANSAPAWSSGAPQDDFQPLMSDNGSNKPKLVVTYTAWSGYSFGIVIG